MLSILSTTLSLLLVAYLPGALLFRLPIVGRELRSRLTAEERVYWSVVLSVATTSVVGMTLAASGAYRFDRLLWGNGAVSVVLGALGGGQLRFPGGSPAVGRTALIPLGLALGALAIFSYVPPAEYVIGGRDPGTYLVEGVQIAQRGSLTVHDSLVSAVPAEYRHLFFPERRRSPSYYGLRFMAFFVVDPEQGSVVGQFPHLYPLWVAVGYGVNGLSGARQAVVPIAVLAVLAVYFCGVWMVGRPAAAAGTALMTLNVAQVWYSRYPNAEILLQFLAFAAILAFSRSSIDGDRYFAPIAAVLLALAVLTHFSAVLLVGGVGLAMIIGLVDGRRLPWVFLLPLSVGGLIVAWYYGTVLTEYLQRPVGITRRAWRLQPLVMTGGTMALVAILWASTRERMRPMLRRWLPHGLLGAVLGLAAYAYGLRVPVGRLAVHDAAALREFANVYVTPAGLALSLVGLALVVQRSFWRNLTFVITVVVFACFIFYKIRIIPEHFWLARRFLPVILPAACLLIGTAATWPWTWYRTIPATHPKRLGGLAVGVAVLMLVSGQFVSATRLIVDHVEYAGIIPQLEAIETRIADDDVLIVEARDASDLHTLAVPLAYIYARNVLLLTGRNPDPDELSGFLTWARGRYRRVLFLGGGGSRILSRSTAARPMLTDQFRVPEYERTYPDVPRRARLKQYDLGLYELVPRVGTTEAFDLDVGAEDDLHVAGFHGKEGGGRDETSFRWSGNTSRIMIPQITRPPRAMTLWLNAGGRPTSLPPPTVDVFLAGRQLGTVTPTNGFQPYVFMIAEEHAAEIVSANEVLEVSIVANTWSPRDALGGGDGRQLGVMVDRLRVD